MQRGTVQEIKRFLPDSVISKARKWRALISVVREFGGKHPRDCPICGFSGLFFAYGQPLMMDSVGPRCRSIGRHGEAAGPSGCQKQTAHKTARIASE
jgi:hypothetical protein